MRRKEFLRCVLVLATLGSIDASLASVTHNTPGVFDVSPTGEATYTVPISLPRGTGGLTPELAFVYGSQRGNGLLGMGLGLRGLSAIQRCPHTRAQDGTVRAVSMTTADRLCLDGNKMRLTSGTYGAANSTYQTEVDTFARVTAKGTTGTGPRWFEVHQRNGLIYEYGNTTDSRIEVTGSATIPRVWALNRIRDRDGNYVDFLYTEDNVNGAYRPAQIKYAGNIGQSLAPSYTIQFIYEARSSADPLVGYDAGYKRKETNRLAVLELRHNGTAIRNFWPYYEDSGSSTPRTRATFVDDCGKNDELCHAAMFIDWTQGINALDAEVSTGQSVAAGSIVHTIDTNADGRSDVVYASGGTWRVRHGQEDDTYGSEINTAIAATNTNQSHSIDYSSDGFRDVLFPDGSGNWRVLQFAASGVSEIATGRPANGAAAGTVAVQDVDGDGREDVLSASGGVLKVRLNSASGLAATETTVYTAASGWTFDTNAFGAAGVDEYKRLRAAIDFNGDGRGDLLARLKQTGTNAIEWKVLVSMGATYKADSNVESSATQRPLLLDVNGDGLIDALGHNGSTWVVSFARGGFDPAVRQIFDPVRAYPSVTTALTDAMAMDYDKDGAADVLVPISGVWQVAYSHREGYLACESTGAPAPANHAARATDIGGDGLPDLSYRGASGNWSTRAGSGFLPDLASGFYDAFGNYALPIFETLTNLGTGHYVRDVEPTFPARRFTGALPVVFLSVQSGTPGWWVGFQYSNLDQHLQGRGLLGFGSRSEFDSRANLRTTQTYSQQYPYIGRTLTARQYRKDPVSYVEKLFAETVNTWSTINAGSGFAARSFPYVSASTRKRWEVGGAYDQALTSLATTSTLVDSYGTPYDVTTTTTEPVGANGIQSGRVLTDRALTPLANLTNDTTNWCLGQVKKIQNTRSHTGFQGNAQTRTTDFAWDTVKCRRTGSTIEPGHSTLQVIRSMGFDAFGNPSTETLTGIGMTARTTTTSWGTTGQFPVSITNPLGQTSTAGYDLGFGVRTSATDPNGIQTTYGLDARGRVISETLPDGTTRKRTYEDCATLGDCMNAENRLIVTETHWGTSWGILSEQKVYLDRWNRPTGTKSKTLNGNWSWTEREYDDRNLTTRESAPCWHASCAYYWTTRTHDQLGRQTATLRPASDSNPALVSTGTDYLGLTTRTTDELGKQQTAVARVIGGAARTADHNGYHQSMDHDAFDNLVRVQDSLGNTLQTAVFDIRGNRTASTDPDRGSWGYGFNALGEQVSQTDANAKTTTFTFDALSRMTQRVEPEGAGTITSTWVWGTSAHNTGSNKYIGRLKSQSIAGTGINTYTEAFTFDALSRPISSAITEGANTYTTDRTYDAVTGYAEKLIYPVSTSGYRLTLLNVYANGALQKVKDFNAGTVFWHATGTDARNRPIAVTLGNGLDTNTYFDAVTHRIASIATGPSGSGTIQNLAYSWDNAGNLMQRQDNNQGLTENFYYDNVHRLDYSTLGGTTNLDVTLDAKGNVSDKSDLGSYTYHPSKIHAVASVNTGGGTMTFSYDNVGNMTNRNGTSLTWYASNLPKAITKDANNSSIFQYGPDRARWKHTYKTTGTTFTHTYIGTLVEKVVSGGVTEFKHFIEVQGESIAMYSRKSSGTNAIYYRHDDHLGSTEHLTDSAGANVVMQSFGAYGQRRGTNWSGTPTPADLSMINATTRKGFTEHEMLDSTGLVHMNGRVFDPVIGRFVSADPFEDCGLLTQGRNRFAYVGNRAVTLKDPTGFWSEPWDSWGGSLTMPLDIGGGLGGGFRFDLWDDPPLDEIVVTYEKPGIDCREDPWGCEAVLSQLSGSGLVVEDPTPYIFQSTVSESGTDDVPEEDDSESRDPVEKQRCMQACNRSAAGRESYCRGMIGRLSPIIRAGCWGIVLGSRELCRGYCRATF